MLKIGDLSRIAHVTVKALRHYSRLGLLKPVWTDRYTGYRYYSLDQLPRLNRILALKDLGFSLEQIRELLDEDLPLDRLRQLFDQKQQELQQRLLSEQARLERVAGRLQQIEREGRLPEYEVAVKSIPALPVAALRAMIPSPADLPEQCQLMRRMVANWVKGSGIRSTGPWIVVYHNLEFSERNLDVEVALVLDRSAPTRSRLSSKAVRLEVLPAVETMASVLHPAQGNTTEPAYSALYAWTERCGYRINGPSRELMLDDPEQAGAASGFTEVQVPVQSLMVYKQQFIENPYRKETEMEPKFVTLPAFTIVGMRYFGNNAHQEIKDMWGVFNQHAGEIKNVNEDAAYGLCAMVEGATPGEFEYVAGLRVSKAENVPVNMVVRQVPTARYAVFTHIGSLEKLHETMEYIFAVWLPQSGYQGIGGLDFEYYNQDFKDFAPDSRLYIYLPIK